MKRLLLGMTALMLLSPVARAQDAAADAREAMTSLDWQKAVTAYETLYAEAQPGTQEWTEAAFGLATAMHHVQPPDAGTIGRARSLFEEVVAKSSNEDYIARSLMSLGRIAELKDYLADQVDLDGARKHYLEVVSRFPDKPIANEAILRAGASLVMAYDAPDFAKVKQGIALLEDWLKKHPKNELAALMWQYAGDSYFMPLRDYKNTMRCYEEADRIGWVDPKNQGAWFWRAAQISDRYLKNNDLAAKYYRKLILDTPTSGKAYEASLALQRMGKEVPISPLLGDLLNPPAPSTQPTGEQIQ